MSHVTHWFDVVLVLQIIIARVLHGNDTEVVWMTTSGAASDGKVVNMVTFLVVNTSAVQSKKNPASPNRSPTVDCWVVLPLGGPYMLWSEMAIKPSYDLCAIFFDHHQGLCHKISSSLVVTRFLFKALQSFWNLTGGSPPVLPNRLSTFQAIGIFFQAIHGC